MSDELDIEGAKYVSSKRAAEISGYARDYIGQLCRSGAVEARRIGGLWYVGLDSLYKHKQKADSYIPTAPRRVEDNTKESLVSFDGKDYISTSRAAEITGYHKDYVGQLARDGGILSRQVGTRRYVERGSILSHKKDKDALLAAVQAEAVGIVRNTDREAENTKSLAEASYSDEGEFMKYTSDERELLPTLEEKRLPASISSPTLDYPGTEDLEEPRYNTVPIRVVSSSGSHQSGVSSTKKHHHGLRRARRGALAAGVATIIVFLALNFTLLRDQARYTLDGASQNKMSAMAATFSSALSEIGAVLEDWIVPELTYRRSNSVSGQE